MPSTAIAKRMLAVTLVSVAAYITMVILMIATVWNEGPDGPVRRGLFDNVNIFALNWEGFGEGNAPCTYEQSPELFHYFQVH